MTKAKSFIKILKSKLVEEEEGKVLKAGVSAYYDTLFGLIRCKVLSVESKYEGADNVPSTAWVVRIKLTGKVPQGYTRGEEIETSALSVLPVKSLVVRGGQYRVMPYRVSGDILSRP